MAFRSRILAGIVVFAGCSSPPAAPAAKATPVVAEATPTPVTETATVTVDPEAAEATNEGTDSWPIPKPEVSEVPLVDDSVTLKTAGAEPHSTLRFSPEPGVSKTVELAMAMQVSMTVGNKTIDPSVLPVVTVQMKVTAAPEAGGATAYAYAVTSASRESMEGASERLKKAMDIAVEGMKESSGSLTIDARGRRTAAEYDLPDVPTPNLRPSLAGFQQSFSQLFVVLPEEPVGVGGSWSSTSHFELSGIPIEQRATYTLQSKKGDTLTLAVAFEQSATGAAEAPAGVALEDTQFGGRGSGTLSVTLDSPFPMDAKAESRSRVLSSVSMGGSAQPVEMDLLSSLAITAPSG